MMFVNLLCIIAKYLAWHDENDLSQNSPVGILYSN